MTNLERLELELRESQTPFFTKQELEYYLDKNNNDLKATIYECALLKSEDDSITLPGGLSIPNNRDYWLRLASKNRPNHSGVR